MQSCAPTNTIITTSIVDFAAKILSLVNSNNVTDMR